MVRNDERRDCSDLALREHRDATIGLGVRSAAISEPGHRDFDLCGFGHAFDTYNAMTGAIALPLIANN